MMSGDREGGERIGDLEAADVEALAEPGGKQAEQNGRGGPDIRAEVNGVRLKGERLVFACSLVELAGA